MKKSVKGLSFVILCGMFCMLLTVTPPGLYGKGFDFQVDFTSRYIFRGWDLNPVHKPAVQPSVTYGFGESGFAVNVWGSFSFEDKEVNETDVTLSYDFKTSENLALSVGFIHYGWYFAPGFTFKNNATHEFYLTAGFPNVILGPELTVYYDIGAGDGLYALLSVGGSMKLKGKLAVDLSASLGYNGGQWLPEDAGTGFSDLNLGAAVPFKAGKVTITPFVTYTFVLLDAVGDENHFWFGVSMAF